MTLRDCSDFPDFPDFRNCPDFRDFLDSQAVHTDDPLLARLAGLERTREVLRLVGNLDSAELHDAHGVEGLAIVGQDKFSNPQVAAPDDSIDHKALPIRLHGPADPYVLPADDSLAGLRIIQNRIIEVDVVLGRKIAGVGCRPMLIKCLAYFLISHAMLLISAYRQATSQRPQSIVECGD